MKGGSVDQHLNKKVWNYLIASRHCDWKYKDSTYSKFLRKIDRRYFNLKNEENNNIIVALYTMEHFVNFSKIIANRNKDNIDISP